MGAPLTSMEASQPSNLLNMASSIANFDLTPVKPNSVNLFQIFKDTHMAQKTY